MVVAGSVLVRQGGAWVQKAAMQLSLNPTNISQSVPNGTRSSSFTVNITGGAGPFTYAWSWQDGGTGAPLSNTTTNIVTITASGNNVLRQGTIRVVVTDTGTGLQATQTGTYYTQFGTPL
jgi:hypothetical protein